MARRSTGRYLSPSQGRPQRSSARGRDSVLLKVLGQAVALLSALVGVLYLTGGAVLVLRFAFARLPSEAVIGQLPRELLVTVALTSIILPAATIAAAWVVVRLLRKPRIEGPTYLSWDGGGRDKFFLVVISLALGGLLVIPVMIVVKMRSNGSRGIIYDPPKSLDVALYIGSAIIVTAFAAFMILYLWPRLMGPLHTRSKFHSAKALSLSFVLVMIYWSLLLLP